MSDCYLLEEKECISPYYIQIICDSVSFWCNSWWARTSSVTMFLDHTQRHTTFGRTLLDECRLGNVDDIATN